MMSEGRNIDPKAIDLISSTIKQYEDKGQIFISDFFFGSLSNETNGTPLLQIEPIADKTLRLNVNVDVFSGKTIGEINKLLAECEKNLSNSLEEAIIHECGHARAIKGLTINEIKSLYSEIADAKIEGISQIAFEDGAEALAEIEVLLTRSDKVPEKAMKFYEKYIRRKK